jgi:hypothetical protein
LSKEIPSVIGRERDGVRQQGFGSLITGYIDSTSLAQPCVVAHQEYKSQKEIECSRFPEKNFSNCGKLGSLIGPCLQAELMLQARFPRLPLISLLYVVDLVGKQRSAGSLRLFSHTVMRYQAFFFTACGCQSPASIAVGTISEASTGICYCYCIYIDISIYILRRSTRQTFYRKATVNPHRRPHFQSPVLVTVKNEKGNQIRLWFCGVF